MSRDDYEAHFRASQAAKRRAQAERETLDAALWGQQEPSAPHNGTSTSRAAAKAVGGRAEADRWRILEYIVSLGDRGATRDELVIHFNLTDKPMGGDTIRPRVWECMDLDAVRTHYGVSEPLLVAPGHRRQTQRGREALVLVATLAGIRMVRDHQREVSRAA
jgi:hypothetical protein